MFTPYVYNMLSCKRACSETTLYQYSFSMVKKKKYLNFIIIQKLDIQELTNLIFNCYYPINYWRYRLETSFFSFQKRRISQKISLKYCKKSKKYWLSRPLALVCHVLALCAYYTFVVLDEIYRLIWVSTCDALRAKMVFLLWYLTSSLIGI